MCLSVYSLCSLGKLPSVCGPLPAAWQWRKGVSPRISSTLGVNYRQWTPRYACQGRAPLPGRYVALEAVRRGACSQGPCGRCCDRELLGASAQRRGSLVVVLAVSTQTPPHPAGRVPPPPHTCRICLNPSGCTLEKMLHSGWARIWKATAQWWFSRGEMSL